MQGRSWMAALTLAAGLSPVAAHADDTPHAAEAIGATTASPNLVKLKLRIAGLGTGGCEVEIKPGHPGCKFQPLTQRVKSDGALDVDLKDVRTLNADRDCTFAITIREPGQPVRTVRRGLRVSSQSEKGQLSTLTCYLSSPSRIAKAGEGPTSKR
jgi:hypothetical protein